MTVLALDTTARGCAAAALLSRDGTLLDSATAEGPLDACVPPLLQRFLASDLEAVVVLTGPGSYTGVRAGMALALGVATARGIPLHGVDVLTAVAAAGPRLAALTAAIDAGRGGAYAQPFETTTAPPRATSAVRRAAWEELGGDGVVVTPSRVEGIAITTVAAAEVLAAAVPLALANAPLPAAGLAAVAAPTAS
ncbi:MAG: tRNA (adenosine(37)-N6)-threonylcarbamoyltransferase complex dimerization subunit type 1 TsaB [Candidatus Dormibacteria bacterium]